MDVRHGEMLALASRPYNTNRFSGTFHPLFREWSCRISMKTGPPRFKPINLAIALQEKAVKPSDKRINDSAP